MNPTKIILDADVIIHFSKGSRLNQLPLILPNYSFSLLDVVYEELNDDYRNELSNHIHFLKKITLINFNPLGIQQKEYAELLLICCIMALKINCLRLMMLTFL